MLDRMIQSRQIEAFRAVMRTGGMTAAAEMIHVTQPAVSRLIRDLEREVGLILFHRRGNLVSPTAEAQALLAEVERLFIGLDQVQDFADDLRSGRGGSLRIAALPAMSTGFLPRFVAKFCRDRPQINVVLEGLSSPAIRDRVCAGQFFDIGLTSYPFQRETLEVTLLHDTAVVVMPPSHELAAKPAITAEDLQDQDLILLTKFRNSLHPVQIALQSVRRRTPIETSLSNIACLLAQEGMGLAIVDPFAADEFVGRGLVIRPFVPALVIGTAVVHARDRPMPIVAQQFHAAFLEHARSFLANVGCAARPENV